MSWLRIEGRMPNHGKVSPLSDGAFRLHVTAMAWCVEQKTDGVVPGGIPRTLPSVPQRKRLDAALLELTNAGLWERSDNGDYVIHDFLKYNPSAAQSEALRQARASAGAAGGRSKADNMHGKSIALASHVASAEPEGGLANAKQNPSSPAGARARSDSDSESDPRSTTTTAGARLGDRLVQPTTEPGQPPKPRKDPLSERVPFSAWFPSLEMLAYCRAAGLPDAGLDAALTEARDALTGRHDFEWFDVKVWRFIDVAIDRHKNPKRGVRTGTSTHGGPSDDWPNEADISLRERIRAGEWPELVADFTAGKLDASLARRRIAALEARRKRDGTRGGEAAGAFAGLVAGVGRVMT